MSNLQFSSDVPPQANDLLTASEEEAFSQSLVEQSSFKDGILYVGDVSFHVAEILKGLDPLAYASTLVSFRDERIRDIAELVTHRFPGPIAYFFHMYANGADNEHQRLQYLRDAWESLIRFVQALLVAEVRYHRVDLRDTNLRFSDLLSDRVSQILNNIEMLIDLLARTQLSIASLRILGDGFVGQLRHLNTLRNNFSHSQTLSVQQVGELIDESLAEFLPILWGLERW